MVRTSLGAVVLFGCLALVLAILAAPLPAQAQSDQWDALYDRIIRLEHEIEGMKSGGGAVPLNPAAVGGGGLAVEDQLRRVLVMLDEIRRSQRSLELRLEQLEGGAPGTTGTIFEQQQSPAPEGDGGFDFSQYQSRELAALSSEQDVAVQVYRQDDPPAAAQPQVLGTLSGTELRAQGQFPAVGGGGSLMPESVEQAALDGAPLPAPGAATGGSAEKLYQGGYAP
jgi:hypothetical protein